MIRLPAGMCQLDDVVYKGYSSSRVMTSFRLLGNEHLEPGGVYYVGDFVATGSTDVSSGAIFTRKVHQRWELFEPRNNFATTTAAMKQAFPNFASVATQDRMPRQ